MIDIIINHLISQLPLFLVMVPSFLIFVFVMEANEKAMKKEAESVDPYYKTLLDPNKKDK